MTTTQPDTSYQGGVGPSGGASPDWGPPGPTGATAVQEPVVAPPAAPEDGSPKQPFVRRLWRGRPEDHRWTRPAFLGTLLLIGALYTWNLTASGYANSFYSAAVQAGSQSWKAFFFGSLDSANAITVDKPPASLWPMALSVRLFGLNSFAILFPQVLMAVATAGVLYGALRRRFSAAAGFIAMAVFALTPVAALMFRFNNPDAALALLMAVTVYCVLRAMEKAQTKWLVWAGAAVGLAFLVKTLQAFLILPPLALIYVVFAPTTLRKRIGQVLLAGLSMIVAGGWWVAIVELWPASSRPYIGGSQNNSFLELTFGYNGLGRINGEETGSVGGGGGGGGWGETGWDRMFSSSIGGQISWLIPAALIVLAAGIALTWKAKRTDTARAAFLAWGGSLLITMVIFSFMQGIFHEYYTVALAPYVAAVIGMGASVLWEERGKMWVSLTMAAGVTATAVWGYVLLNRSSDYLPWLKWLVLVGGLVAALGLVFVSRLGRRLALGVVGLSFVAALAGPTAYTLTTLNEGHTGSIVTAGPAVSGGRGGPGGGGGMGGGPGGGGGMPGQNQQGGTGQNQQNGNGGGGAAGQPPTGGFPGGGQNQQGGNGQTGQNGQTQRGGGTGDGGGMGGGGGGMGGLLNGATVSSEAKALLEKNSGDYTWVAAAIGAQNAASYQLSTGDPVMAIGGFNGSDPSPTLAQFKKYVEDGKIHYFISSGSMGGGGGGSSSGTGTQISEWVQENFKEVTVGSSTFYDLTQPTS